MSASIVFTFGFLLLFIFYVSCSPIYHPIYGSSYNDNSQPYYGQYNNNEDDQVPLMIYPKLSAIHSFQRSLPYFPRAIRNSWFRVSTYQHMKPTSDSEEKSAGDNLLRWG